MVFYYFLTIHTGVFGENNWESLVVCEMFFTFAIVMCNKVYEAFL